LLLNKYFNRFLEDLGFIKENKDQWFEFTDKKSVINQKIDLSSVYKFNFVLKLKLNF